MSDLQDEVVALTQDLIRIDSTNAPGNETAVARHLAEYLADAGVDCELVARDPRRANLVARIPGTGGAPSLAFVGHLAYEAEVYAWILDRLLDRPGRSA